MGDFWATYFTQYAFGENGPLYRRTAASFRPGRRSRARPKSATRFRSAPRELVRMPRDYYSFDRLFDQVRELGGVTGFAHQGMSFHGYRGMTLNVLRGKIDFLELAQFCVPEGPLARRSLLSFPGPGLSG